MRVKTSESNPIRVDFIVHPVLPPESLGITFAPGKKCDSLFGGVWNRSLTQDLRVLREVYGTNLIVNLLERKEERLLGIRGYDRAARKQRIQVYRLPIPDMGVVESLDTIAARVSQKWIDIHHARVVVHCRGGLGRAGTFAAAVLISRGVGAEEAIETVRRCRPGAIQAQEQEQYLYEMGGEYVRD